MTLRPSWFRCDASRLLGALAGMKPDAGYLYSVILLRIYEVGGPIHDDETVLSRRTGLTAKRVALALAWLVAHGKVERLSDGLLDSVTTHEELSFREKTINDARIAGKEAAKRKQNFNQVKAQSLQQNRSPSVDRPPTARSTGGHPPSTEEEVEEEGRKKGIGPSVANDQTLSVSAMPRTDDRKKSVRKNAAYPPDFEAFWKAYPTDAGMAKKEAFTAWQKLAPEDRSAALTAVPAWKAHCATIRDYRMLHACRYLSQRRFDGCLAVAERTKTQVFVRIGSPEWRAWQQWYAETNGKNPPVNKEGTGWWFKAEWPPGQQQIARNA